MAKIYKETKVDVRPVAPSAVVDIQIPTQESTQRRARFSLSSVAAQDIPTVKDEEDFAKRFLATQSSIYFRQRRVYPRTFLWRVVDDSRVLEIQSADLSRASIDHHDANFLLRLDFQETILPSGVALADTEDHEVLNVFVLTSSRRLYTVALRPEFFRRASSIDENIQDWCKFCTPSPLTFAYPHRLHASSTTELFISLDSGALLRLTRRAGDDGSHWTQIMFDEKGWGASIRGLVKWNAQQSIRYNERTLDQHTPNAIATTPDQTYVFAACLNHTLKVWNLATNKLVGSKDLLDRELPSQQHESTAYFLNPSDSTFVRVFNAERALDGGYRFYVVTYSPHEEGQFKFWAVKGGLTTPLTIEDLFPGTVLRPRDPDTSGNLFWSVSDFQIRPMDEGKRMELWILWRNNNLYQLYSLHFDFQSLEEDWSTNWTSVAMDTRRQDFPPALVVTDIVDPTEKWLKYFFYPGRYNPEVLETAFGTYQEAIKLRSSAAVIKRNAPLQERLCSTIAGSVSLRKYTDNDLDYAKYRTDTDTRWRQFWQIAEDLKNRRLEPICLAYDTYSDLPWVVLTDSCVVVRECSATELLLHNSASELRDEVAIIGDRWRHRNLETELGNRFDGASHLINVAAGFRKRLSGEAHRCFQTALDAEIFLEPSLSAPDRLTAFQERSELGDHVSDDVFDGVCAAMNELLNIYKLPKELFYAIMDTIPLGFPAKDSDLLPTAFGLRVTMSGSQETILHIRRTLHDLLMLVVFVSGEVGQEDSSSFDAVELFTTLLDLIKEYEMLYWLGSTTRISPHRGHHEPTDSNDTKTRGPGHVSTILEDLFAIHIKPRPTVGVPQSYTLTLGIRDVLSWVTRQGEVAFPNVLVFIQCDLIANGNIELASEFLRFQPSTAWATYAKGRLFVARTEYETAALYFQKAAHSLSSGRALGNLHEMSSSLLDILSVDSFHNGLAKYFQHVLSIFEQARSFSHVADFASLGLQALESDHKSKGDLDYQNLRTDLLSRLFYASLKTCQFDTAYSALSRYTNFALQKSALSSLITAILNACGPGTAGLQQLLHFPLWLAPNLSSYVDEILLSLAKKQTSFSSSLDSDDQWWEMNHAPDYHRILHAYRIARDDLRGAAELGYQTVQRLRYARDAPSMQLTMARQGEEDTARLVEEDDLESKEIRHELLSLINLLACVDKREAYILVELDAPPSTISDAGTPGKRRGDDDDVFMDEATPSKPAGSTTSNGPSSPSASGSFVSFLDGNGRRRSSGATSVDHNNGKPPPLSRRQVIVTLEHLRREYQAELDRVSRLERGDWEFGAVETGADEDQNMDDTMLVNI